MSAGLQGNLEQKKDAEWLVEHAESVVPEAKLATPTPVVAEGKEGREAKVRDTRNCSTKIEAAGGHI